MNNAIPKQQERIFVNARFLTRRITGLERYAIEMSLQMKKIRPSLTFVAPKDILHQSIARELGVEVCGRLTGHLWEQIELPFFLRRQNNPYLLNLMNTGPIFYRNQLTVVHDLAFLRNPHWFSRSAAVWFTFLVPRVVNASSRIVVDSSFTKNEIVELLKVSSKKIHVIYPGISEFFHSQRDDRHTCDSGATILTVSTLDPRKNLERLIEGFKLLKFKGAKLIIVGGANSFVFGRSLKPENVFSDPAIKFLGYISDTQLVDLYGQADIFVSVSLYEGFGFPPLEALASGCNVLVSDIPSHREIFGDGATYVNPLDTLDIAEKLNFLLTKRTKADRTKINNTLLRFRWHRAAEELMIVADDALKVL
jgi:glycosyltransferase involved in cell wall biosynthesis